MKNNCKIIMAASRSQGQTADNVKDVAQQYGYKIIRFAPLYTEAQGIN